MESEQFEMDLPDEGQMRLENEIMKLRLHAEYGAIFPEHRVPAEDPESEYVFLKRVLQLHQRVAGMPPRPLAEVLDFGRFRPASEFEDGPELSDALDEALDYLEDCNVIVDFECDYPDRVMYEFVTVELASLEVIGRPAEDEYICVLYEAFHPNPKAELEVFCIDFFASLIGRQLSDEHRLFLARTFSLQDKGCPDLIALLLLVERFLEYFPTIEAWRIEFDGSMAEPPESWLLGDRIGTVYGRISYRVAHGDGDPEELEGPFRICVRRIDGLWKITDFDFYGFSWLDDGGHQSER